ncbi:MAG: chemotaxis protein CheW [Chloroflexi bacterium]|nr:chemotaxis protein CheW [Chloroflexota bacterium]
MSDKAGAVATRVEPERTTREGSTRAGDRGGKFLTFFLDNEEYGLKILKVQEIFGMMPVTPVPRTPQFILGVINLRGKVIPVMDLRLKFGMAAKAQTEETCIIVVQAQGLEMGVVVDKVSEVLDIPEGDIEDAPSFGAQVNTDFLLGIGKSDGKVKLLLDIDRVLATEDVLLIDTLRQGVPGDAGARAA